MENAAPRGVRDRAGPTGGAEFVEQSAGEEARR